MSPAIRDRRASDHPGHRCTVVTGHSIDHHEGDRTLFMPRCTCGWEGAWMLTRKDAGDEGRKHLDGPAPRDIHG